MLLGTLYKKRHDAMFRVKKAGGQRWEVVKENQVDGGANLLPDLVLKMGREILIIDVAIPFENGLEALTQKRIEKEKYKNIADELMKNGSNARVEAILVCSLGAWDTRNDKIFRRVCSNKYLKVMRNIMFSETIAYSPAMSIMSISILVANSIGWCFLHSADHAT